MISDEQEYPELNRRLRLVPRDPKLALDPAVCACLDEVAKMIQPVMDKAMELVALDIAMYGFALSPEHYALEAWKELAPMSADERRVEEIRRLRQTLPPEKEVTYRTYQQQTGDLLAHIDALTARLHELEQENQADANARAVYWRDRLAEAHAALERIIGMCDVPPPHNSRCTCGRPNGLMAVVACAQAALLTPPPTPGGQEEQG